MKITNGGSAVRFRAASTGFRTLLADAREAERSLKVPGNRYSARAVSPFKVAGDAMGVNKGSGLMTASVALAQARQQAHARAEALVQERSEAFVDGHARLDTRQIDLICRELLLGAANEPQRELLPAVPVPVAVEPARPGPFANTDAVTLATARTRAALALAKRIELFLSSSGPALELPLPDVLGARVRIERIGPNEVALTLKGNAGPPRAEAVGRIREAVAARGLKVGALTVG